MSCPTCGGQMKPLLTSWYCPRDCDRPRTSIPATSGPGNANLVGRSHGWEAHYFPSGSTLGDISWAERAWWGGPGQANGLLNPSSHNVDHTGVGPGWLIETSGDREGIVRDVRRSDSLGVYLFRREP